MKLSHAFAGIGLAVAAAGTGFVAHEYLEAREEITQAEQTCAEAAFKDEVSTVVGILSLFTEATMDENMTALYCECVFEETADVEMFGYNVAPDTCATPARDKVSFPRPK